MAISVDIAAIVDVRSYSLNNEVAMKTTRTKIKRDVFRPSLPGIRSVPDPTDIFSTWQWFLLDAVSDNLVRYQHGKGEFYPALADRWSIDGDKVSFVLKPDLKFHDGSNLTSADVVASFHRVITLKRSTHFDIWNFLTDLKTEGPDKITFNFKGNKESLFLFLSSPEASIWAGDDIQGTNFVPRRFSGFYWVSQTSETGVSLERNPYSPRRESFKNSPERVEVSGHLNRWQSLEGIKNGTIDAFIGDYIPFSELCVPHPQVEFLKSIPLVFIYLLKMHDSAPNSFDDAALAKIWKLQDSSGLMRPASSILPPGMEGALTKSETFAALNQNYVRPAGPVKIGASANYFSEDFLKQIKSEMKSTGMDLQYQMLNPQNFIKAIDDAKSAPFDYLLLGYVASDKFPFSQLKLLTGPRDIDVQIPDDNIPTADRLEKLRNYQKSFLHSQTIVPFFFVPSVTVYRADLDIGNQPTTEAELQFWRINENL